MGVPIVGRLLWSSALSDVVLLPERFVDVGVGGDDLAKFSLRLVLLETWQRVVNSAPVSGRWAGGRPVRWQRHFWELVCLRHVFFSGPMCAVMNLTYYLFVASS